jgi:hypothetical protein
VELIRSGELVILGFHSDGSGAPYAGPMEAYIGYLLGAAGTLVIGLVPSPLASETDWAVLAGGAVFFGAFAVALEALERWVVRRPQPFTSPSLVAADDAIRAQSVHAIAGAGLALLLVTLSGLFVVLTASDVDLLNATMWLPALVAFVLSIRACRDIGQQPWHVRRRLDRPAGAAPA